MQLLKMHGSTNWVYCDSCRNLFANYLGCKIALHAQAFLEEADFKLFYPDSSVELRNDHRQCPKCNNQLTGRLATFSYQKAFSINQFQTIWNKAFSELQQANRWLFIGYSLPEADYEFRHLLKAAQLGREQHCRWNGFVILGGNNSAPDRYRAFFGLENQRIYKDGLRKWVDEHMGSWICESLLSEGVE